MIERTLVIIKPDGVQRSLAGRIISRFEDAGLKIVGMKMNWIDDAFAKEHYSDIGERYGKRILENLVNYIKEGPVIAMILEGVDAVENVRKITGSTYPNEALPGTIRGDFSHISKNYANKKERKVGNLIHASATSKEAKEEIKLWFSIDELHNYKTVHEQHTF
ncbi:MAG: nucleoside-diphosphate kinase [Candidatus Woesearchaeota archaeon]|jgi:nucleoside-diphosphate kinase|nr:nucleoside-diphosphate kinase [Candidatus Woesearchaeota archaeon]MDP7505879.1 nucleoside-diphosphate kinase [Candidatus Woesearchaeota archaeon]MDP7610330.1 nucleoside-diphosphate kinase [Candidatus Woesearchaeota archaeon]|tara:strand:+ start:2833 stop:3321 length:489 start_codon:yes stop_codon:yes gene_type:complete